MAINEKLVEELVAGRKTPEEINELLRQLTKAVLERALGTELTEHLGYEKHEPGPRRRGNTRNGHSRKVLKGDFGDAARSGSDL